MTLTLEIGGHLYGAALAALLTLLVLKWWAFRAGRR